MHIELLKGQQIQRHLAALAQLRIEVFAQWPYLYVGTREYEQRYLESFAAAESSVLVVACDVDRVVGASSAMALRDESPALRAPFEQPGLTPSSWFYLAESVLRSEYRKRGLGHRFFDAREQAGREQGFEAFTFCSVERALDDPRRPDSHFELDPFWRRRGYRPSTLCCELSWPEPGQDDEVGHALRYWVRGTELPQQLFEESAKSLR